MGSSSKQCSPEVFPRCVAAGKRSARDTWSTLSARPADRRRFTRSVTRMYLLCWNASRFLHRVLTTTRRRRVTVSWSSRHGGAMSEAAVEGTRA